MMSNRGRRMDYRGYCEFKGAILHGNLKNLEQLYNEGVDVNARGPDGLCPLHVAVQAGKEYVVEFLLSHGVDIDAISSINETALYFAARDGHLDIVKRLLQFGPNVNHEGNKQAIYAAVYPGRTIMFNPRKRDNGTTRYEPVSLMYKVKTRQWLPKKGNERKKLIFEALLGYGFVYDVEKGCEPKFFHGAVELGLMGIVEDLLKYGADASMELDGETPLLVAIKTNQPAMIDLLLHYGADLNAHDGLEKTPIYYAALTGNVKLVKSLLSPGANISDYREIVHAAISGNSPETLEEILNRGTIDINDCTIQGMTALDASLRQYKNAGLIAVLLDKGANVNERSGTDQNSPLHYVSISGDHANCETLLKKGAKVGCKNKYGHTPLHVARSSEIVKLLLQYGADVNAQDSEGRSPLHIAPGNALIDLLQAGADIDAVDEKGDTPVHIAFKTRQIRKVRLLLNYGADITICDRKNAIPLLYLSYQDQGSNIDQTLLKLYIFHVAKLQACNFDVSEELLGCMGKCQILLQASEEDLRAQRRLCDEEIRKLQVKKIQNSNISFYECLTKNISSLAILLNNEQVVQGLQSDDVSEEEFPVYALMLKTKFRKAKERKALIDQCYELFGFLTGELAQFPAYCAEAIMHYLSNQDLQMFIAAFKTTSQYPTETDSMNWSDEEPLSDSSESSDAVYLYSPSLSTDDDDFFQ